MNYLKQRSEVPEVGERVGKRQRVLRWVRLIGGWTLLVLGVLGLFLPVLQGVLMIAAGVALLYRESPFLARHIDRGKPRYRLYRWKYSAWKANRKKKKKS